MIDTIKLLISLWILNCISSAVQVLAVVLPYKTSTLCPENSTIKEIHYYSYPHQSPEYICGTSPKSLKTFWLLSELLESLYLYLSSMKHQ